jgi:histidine triad (HIT) family protein
MKRLLYRLAQTRMGGVLRGFLFANFSFGLPMKRLRDTDTLMAFFHPRPSHKLHILIVPKLKYKTILDVPSGENAFASDLFEIVKSLIMEFNLEKGAYRLILNGGDYQEVGHLHRKKPGSPPAFCGEEWQVFSGRPSSILAFSGEESRSKLWDSSLSPDFKS